MVVAFVLIRLATAHWRPIAPGVDTGTYKAIASLAPWDPDFFTGPRPWGTPLVWKLLVADRVIVAGHHLISVAAWVTLAGVTARSIVAPRLRLVAFALVLLFALTWPVTIWDSLLLSESLAVSTFALVLAAWLALARGASWRRVGLILVATLFWVAMRDTNAYAALLAVPAILVWAALSRRRAPPLALAAGIVAIFAGSAALADEARRDELPVLHVYGHRLLADPEAGRYFREHGLPEWQALSRRRPISELDGLYGRMLHGPCSTECRAVYRWLREKGSATYVRYMLSHPDYTLLDPIRQIHSWIAADFRSGGLRGFRRLPLPDVVESTLYPHHATQIFFWLVLIGLAAVVAGVRRGVPVVWAVPVATVVTALPHGMITWLGDENPGRHGLTAAIQARLGLLILALFVADRLLAGRTGSSAAGRA